MPRIQVPEKLAPFILKPKRFKLAIGGRGGAKSQSFSDMLIQRAHEHNFKIGCFREYQNSIDDSVYALLVSEITRLGLRGFKPQGSQIKHKRGGEFRFKGLARNPESVKSMHGFKIFWVEEAQTVSQNSLKLLTPTLRETGSEIWLSLNPMSSADPISVRFLEPFYDELLDKGVYEDDLHYITWINYYDNPWFPEELEQERQYDYQTMSRALYNHVWLGHYNDSVENALILAEWFDAAVDAHKKLGFKSRGTKVMGFDPADTGDDKKAYCIRHGSIVEQIEMWDDGDVNEGCDRATSEAVTEYVDLFSWDCDGMGVSLNRQVKDTFNGKKVDHVMFKGSNGPDRPGELYNAPGFKTDVKRQKTNKEVFKNKRAQYYWYLRDRFYNSYRAVVKGEYVDPDTMISIPSDLPLLNKLRAEVCRVPRKFNPNGLIQLMSKPEMKRLKIKSPNMADALMMSLVVPDETYDGDDLEFKSLW